MAFHQRMSGREPVRAKRKGGDRWSRSNWGEGATADYSSESRKKPFRSLGGVKETCLPKGAEGYGGRECARGGKKPAWLRLCRKKMLPANLLPPRLERNGKLAHHLYMKLSGLKRRILKNVLHPQAGDRITGGRGGTSSFSSQKEQFSIEKNRDGGRSANLVDKKRAFNLREEKKGDFLIMEKDAESQGGRGGESFRSGIRGR